MISVRFAEPQDLATLMSFDPWPGDRIGEIIERRMLVADLKGTVRGYVSWQNKALVFNDYINKLVTDPNWRRRGVAKALLYSIDRNLTGRVFISTSERNEGARTLLHSTGWVHAGQIVGLLPSDEPEIFFSRDVDRTLDRQHTRRPV